MGAGLLSAADLTRASIEALLASAEAYRRGEGRRHRSAVIGLCFFEDSVRTRVGFEVAAARLGASTTALLQPKHSAAMGWPESIDDALRSIGDWCDVLCLRHPEAAAPARVAGQLAATVINCGNGDDEHPTQALIDLFAIQDQVGAIDGLRIAIVGNLLQSRCAHSLALALAAFEDVTIRTIAPHGLHLPPALEARVASGGATVEHSESLELEGCDAVYVAGLPAGTPGGPDLTIAEQARFHITAPVLAALPLPLRVLCPLPRVDEIAAEVDDLPQAGYFAQSAGGVAVRMAVLDHVLAAGGLRSEAGSSPMGLA